MGSPLAFEAEVAEVEGIDPFHEWIEVLLFIGDEAGLEVPAQGALCAYAGSGEVGGPDEGFPAIDDDGLGMNSRAEDAFEKVAIDERGVSVEVFPEPRTGFLGMEKADGDAVVDEVGEDFEQGDEAASFFHVEVLDVGGDDPEKLLSAGKHVDDDALVNVFIKNKVGHRGRDNTTD